MLHASNCTKALAHLCISVACVVIDGVWNERPAHQCTASCLLSCPTHQRPFLVRARQRNRGAHKQLPAEGVQHAVAHTLHPPAVDGSIAPAQQLAPPSIVRSTTSSENHIRVINTSSDGWGQGAERLAAQVVRVCLATHEQPIGWCGRSSRGVAAAVYVWMDVGKSGMGLCCHAAVDSVCVCSSGCWSVCNTMTAVLL